MQINAVNNQSAFGSKVRLQNELVFYIAKMPNRANTLLKRVKQLEKNGNNDTVILSLKSIKNSNSIKDYISMDLYEKRSDASYVTEETVDVLMTKINEQGTKNFAFNINKMYKQAKANMTPLFKRMDKFIPYL